MGLKFKIGDHIMANPLSDGEYSVTSYENAWRGYVADIEDEEDEYPLGVISEDHYLDGRRDVDYWVSEEYFDLISDEELAEPEGDLFAGLFG